LLLDFANIPKLSGRHSAARPAAGAVDKLGWMEFIDIFSFILTRIMLALLSPGSAKADVGLGGN